MLTWFLPSFTVQAKKPCPLPWTTKKLILAQEKPEFYSSELTLVINGEEVKVNVKAIQRHPVRWLVHLDFVRV